ncbi:hypothetical protein STCU_10460 [Strigomonas culicis]|uniref:Uncharacterized protein n=1 Tax=Strigomonas culicis TaxID=28005 RepID=S9TLK3_9TRYP|nr:hypothetical protein STCU_10460 [Strigomonas culicis]|eukprot:EPY17684.1 hypothetical protein STCU_10460 [Strigomonas culicis]
MVLDEADPRGLYGKAVLRFAQARYKPCQELCQLGLELCAGPVPACEDLNFRLRFSELLARARSLLPSKRPSTSAAPPVASSSRAPRRAVWLLTRSLDVLVPFCGPLVLLSLDHALSLSLTTRGPGNQEKGVVPLFHARLLRAAKNVPLEMLTTHLKRRSGYGNLVEEVTRKGPTEFLTPPLHLLNIVVVAVQDMQAFHVKVYLIGVVNRTSPSAGGILQSQGVATDVGQVVMTKYFFICRTREEDPWLVNDIRKEAQRSGTEKLNAANTWHLDTVLTTSLESYLQKNR